MSDEIYELADQAIINIFGRKINYDTDYPFCINEIMGKGFWIKSWGGKRKDDLGDVTIEELERLRLFAGPHGRTVWKAKIARRILPTEQTRQPQKKAST